MKIKKPNWTPLQLNDKCLRWSELMHQTEAHEPECQCNSCMELFGLDALLDTFSEDEKATAVIETNKLQKAA